MLRLDTKKERITVLIPAHRESRSVMKHSIALVNSRLREYDSEILIVENGSDELEDLPNTRYYSIEQGGLGIALRYGLLKASNEHIFFLPADMSYDLSFVDFALQQDADLVIGSKAVDGSKVDRPMTSKAVSFAYGRYVKWRYGLKVHDATGAKLYRRSTVLPVAEKIADTGISFEVKLIQMLQKAGRRIIEIPVIVHDRDRRGTLRWLR